MRPSSVRLRAISQWALKLQFCIMILKKKTLNKNTAISARGQWVNNPMAVPCGWDDMMNQPVIGGFPSQRPVTRSFGFFICDWTNAWTNNRDAGDLRHHRAHHDVTVVVFVHHCAYKCLRIWLCQAKKKYNIDYLLCQSSFFIVWDVALLRSVRNTLK